MKRVPKRCAHHFKNTYSPITLGNISFINVVFIFRCSSSLLNPVYPRHVDFSSLVFSPSDSPRQICPVSGTYVLCWVSWSTIWRQIVLVSGGEIVWVLCSGCRVPVLKEGCCEHSQAHWVHHHRNYRVMRWTRRWRWNGYGRLGWNRRAHVGSVVDTSTLLTRVTEGKGVTSSLTTLNSTFYIHSDTLHLQVPLKKILTELGRTSSVVKWTWTKCNCPGLERWTSRVEFVWGIYIPHIHWVTRYTHDKTN